MKLQDLKNKKIAILGYGKEGKSTLKFLERNGIDDITVLDRSDIEVGNYKKIVGDRYMDNLGEFDVIFKSGGISIYDDKIVPYLNKVITQTQFFYDNYKGQIVSVTQTKGKSTVVSMVHEMLKKAGKKVKLYGNIGNPPLDEYEVWGEYDIVVYELSSYMIDGLEKAEDIALLGNIYPDHLGWHRGYENYKNAKLNIIKGAKKVFVNTSLESIVGESDNIEFFGKVGGKFEYREGVFYKNGTKLFDTSIVKLKGEHNMSNILSILYIVDYLGVDMGVVRDVLSEFVGLPHRLEYIGTYRGVIFYDDANSGTPESTIEAIKTFGTQIGTIFLGGEDRGYEYHILVEYLEKYDIKNIVLFPDAGDSIKKLLDESYKMLETRSMDEAVRWGYGKTGIDKICLLSCGAPSYSLWKNFEEKGDEFKNAVLKYS